MAIDLKRVLSVMRARENMNKVAFQPPMDPAAAGGAPPMDPSMMGGAPPMDPAAAGGAPPMDPSMMQGGMPMDPAMQGGAPPMGGGQPPMDPAMMQNVMAALQDPNVQAMLAQMGIIVDPQQGPVDQATGQVIPPEQMIQILQQLASQMQGAGVAPMDPSMMGGAPPMDPAAAGGAPPMDPSMMGGAPPMDPSMMGGAPPMPKASAMDPNAMQPAPAPAAPQQPAPGQDMDKRLKDLETTVDKIAKHLGINPGTESSVASEGLTDEAQNLVNEGANEKTASERSEDPSFKLNKLISQLRGQL